MILAGNFDIFSDAFPQDLLPDVFALVVDEWPNAPRPVGNPLENRITNRFLGHLTNAMRKKSFPAFKFQYRPKLADAGADSESGEVDIYVDSFSRHPDAYFVFECKRLNVTYPSGFQDEALKYVGDGGMGCFILGQYPATCDCGGMLGYVMDGNIATAAMAINRSLRGYNRQLQLKLPHQLHQAAIVPSDNRIQQTKHDVNQREFLVYHFLLAY